MADDSKKPADAAIGYGILAALVWLSLSLYAMLIVPLQFSEPGLVPGELPAASAFVYWCVQYHVATWLALIGICGCAAAYRRRNVRLAKWMIGSGALLIALLILHLATQPPPPPRKTLGPPLQNVER